MGTPERLVEIREDHGYTRRRLAEELGKPYATITKYETGEREPGHAYIVEIAKKFGVTTDYILGLSDDATAKVSLSLTKSEADLIKKYRALDEHGKEIVTLTLDCEHRRIIEEKDRPEKVMEIFPTRKYLQSATAGYGDFNDDSSYEIIDLVRRPPVGTSFIVTVNGDSMEPTYHDGDQLFVRAQERVELGDIGLFTQGPKLYVKESGPDGLISHNEAYELITGTEDEPIRAQGKIIGVCSEDYLLSH